jgi:hypothetical protein
MLQSSVVTTHLDGTGGVGAAVPDSQYIPPSLTVPGIVEAEYFKQGIYTHIDSIYIENVC